MLEPDAAIREGLFSLNHLKNHKKPISYVCTLLQRKVYHAGSFSYQGHDDMIDHSLAHEMFEKQMWMKVRASQC